MTDSAGAPGPERSLGPVNRSGALRSGHRSATPRSVALVQHALLGILLVLGLVRAVLDGTAVLPLVLGSVLFALWYVVWVVDVLGVAPTRRSSPRRPALWLLGLALGWGALVLVSHEFVWIAFSLWLLAGHLLGLGPAIGLSLVVFGVVIWAPTLATGEQPGAAGVIGPAIGALFALALSRGQQSLVREAVERRRLVASLLRAQAESDRLGAELAAAQHESGILAERTRLSREIHDTLAQGFSSILLLARAAPPPDASRACGALGAGEPGSATMRRGELLRQIEECAAENLLEARRVVGALAPDHLEGSGLVAALRRILDAVSTQTAVGTELRVEGEAGGSVDGLPTAVEVALLRAAQGALANVRQHSHASRVVVTLTDAGDSVRLDVVDDGRGFDAAAWALAPPSPPELGGYGLRSSRARLRELGGGLEIESRPGSGTALSAYVPLRVTAALHSTAASPRSTPLTTPASPPTPASSGSSAHPEEAS